VDDERDHARKTFTQRWMSRLAFSFIIIAGFLLWQAFQVHQVASSISPRVRFALYLLGALCSAVMAGLGLRERHRSQE
jgi:hypothetical protein